MIKKYKISLNQKQIINNNKKIYFFKKKNLKKKFNLIFFNNLITIHKKTTNFSTQHNYFQSVNLPSKENFIYYNFFLLNTYNKNNISNKYINNTNTNNIKLLFKINTNNILAIFLFNNQIKYQTSKKLLFTNTELKNLQTFNFAQKFVNNFLKQIYLKNATQLSYKWNIFVNLPKFYTKKTKQLFLGVKNEILKYKIQTLNLQINLKQKNYDLRLKKKKRIRNRKSFNG